MSPSTEGDREQALDVREYKVHISSRYLELTKQKLELTRLPKEEAPPTASASALWWQPKATVEPLIDYWLEEYAWPREEALLNERLPQFRVTVQANSFAAPTRVHVIHARSSHLNAIPLLLIPPFPFTNLSLGHLVELFTAPDDPDNEQAYHVLIPSLPGLGFSDALPLGVPVVETTAHILDETMKKLGYDHYIASNTVAASSSPAHVDWNLTECLALHYAESCVGVHLIQPPLTPPSLSTSPAGWMKWKMFNFFRTPMLGYSKEDVSARKCRDLHQRQNPWSFSLDSGQAGEPSMMSYALCDSPVGMLLFVLMLVKLAGFGREFSPPEILTLTQLMWLPGPEGMLRFWASSAKHVGRSKREEKKKNKKKRPMVGITVFHSGDKDRGGHNAEETALPRRLSHSCSCPAWAKTHFRVVSQRHVSEEPGLVVWERPDVIVRGVRDMTKGLLANDARLKTPQASNTVLLEQVTVEGEETAPAIVSESTVQGSGSNSPLPVSPLDDRLPKDGQEVVKGGTSAFKQDSSGYLKPPAR